MVLIAFSVDATLKGFQILVRGLEEEVITELSASEDEPEGSSSRQERVSWMVAGFKCEYGPSRTSAAEGNGRRGATGIFLKEC